MEELIIDEWVKKLSSLPREKFPEQVNAFVCNYSIEVDSLQRYAYFSREHYTRNLIFKDDVVEVLALCWEVGQISAIHNHRDQHCWMIMAQGRLENMNYRVLDRDPETMTCRLEPSATSLVSREQPLAVEEEEPVHRVVNCQDHGQRAISVHVYSRPFDTCEIYSYDKGTYGDVQLSNYSEYGKLLDQA